MRQVQISRLINGAPPADRLAKNILGLDLSGNGTTGGVPGDKSYFSLYFKVLTDAVSLESFENFGIYLKKETNYNGDTNADDDLTDILALGNAGYGLRIKNPATGLYSIPITSSAGASLATKILLKGTQALAYNRINDPLSPLIVTSTGFTGQKVHSFSSNTLVIQAGSFTASFVGTRIFNTTRSESANITGYLSATSVILDRVPTGWLNNDNLVVYKISTPTDGKTEDFNWDASSTTYGNVFKVDFEFSIPQSYSRERKKQFQIAAYCELAGSPANTVTSQISVQHEFENIDPNSIKICTDFPSDLGTWRRYWFNNAMLPNNIQSDSVDGASEVGDATNPFSHSKAYTNKFTQWISGKTKLLYRLDASKAYPNGFHPNVIFIGNHNLELGDYVIFRAFKAQPSSSTYQTLASAPLFVAYEIKIPYHPIDMIEINYYAIQKCSYFELEFNYATSLKETVEVGRIILGTTLPTKVTNNMSKDFSFGYRDNCEEVVTEGLSRIYNRKSFLKALNFEIRMDANNDKKLLSELKKVQIKGNGNQPILVIPNPKDKYWMSIYGVLTQSPAASNDEGDLLDWNFDIEEFE